MKYCEEFLSKIVKSEYLEIYDNLDIEKMKEIVQENIDYLMKLKGEKAVEEIINNDKLIKYFQWLVKEKTILYIPKEFLTYIYLIKERFGGKVLEDLISMLIKYEEIFQISTKFIIETIGKNIANLDKIIDLYTLNIATGNVSVPDISNIPTIILINDDLSSQYGVLAPTAIHEFIHLANLDSPRFPGYKDLWYMKSKYIITILSRLYEKNISLYKIINEHIKPYSPLYREYENIEIKNDEFITELTTIRILENANMEDLYLNRKKFIEEMLNQIIGKKKEVGISKIPREDYLISYLTAYELLEKREISKNIIETIDEVLELYIEDKLKS